MKNKFSVRALAALSALSAAWALLASPVAWADSLDPPQTHVAAGYSHTCSVNTAGGASCWGENANGGLGDTTTVPRHTPVGVSGLGSGVVAIAPGGYHTCALTTSGGVKCWGYNAWGQVGDNSTTHQLAAVDVSGLGSGVAAIALGYGHSCALTSAGGVKCWGNNDYGQLGDNSTTQRLAPVDVTGLSSGVVAIESGSFHACALTAAGGVKCWGKNATAQLGDNSTTQRLAPVDVAGLASGVAAVAAGDNHSCALTTAGAVKCWGHNSFGQVGDNSHVQRFTPVDVSGLGSGVAAIAAGDHHSCALTTGGSVKCWGYNTVGQIGDGTDTNRLAPVDVAGLSSGIAAVAAGNSHTCALSAGGAMKCWGNNSNGQVGDNTTTHRSMPVDVTGLPTSARTSQSIAFTPPAALAAGVPTPLSATASSALGVVFDSWTPGTCSVSGNSVTATAVGLCGLRASQSGDATHAPAPQQRYLVPIGTGSQVITFGPLSNRTSGESPFTLVATGGASGNPVTFSVQPPDPGVCSLSGPNGATLTILAAGTCSIVANQAGNAHYTPAPPVTQGFTISAAGGGARPRDLSGEGNSDIILRGPGGEIAAWLVNGASISSTLLQGPGTGYQATHIGDFNDDGKMDLLLTGPLGEVVMWIMDGAAVTSSTALLGCCTGYVVDRLGDFNGDGTMDILLRGAEGDLVVWLVDGPSVIASAVIQGAGTGYAPVAIGDFNGDGRDDIVLAHGDGRVAMWLMNGTAVATSANLLGAGTGYVVSHVGNFNNDSNDDLLFKGPSGEIALWLMNGTTIAGSTLLSGASPWLVSHIADVDADGQDDIVLRGPAGQIVIWEMAGTAIASSTLLYSGGPWLVTHTGDYNADARSDLLLKGPNGEIVVWLMNGSAIANATLLVGSTTWVAAP